MGRDVFSYSLIQDCIPFPRDRVAAREYQAHLMHAVGDPSAPRIPEGMVYPVPPPVVDLADEPRFVVFGDSSFCQRGTGKNNDTKSMGGGLKAFHFSNLVDKTRAGNTLKDIIDSLHADLFGYDMNDCNSERYTTGRYMGQPPKAPPAVVGCNNVACSTKGQWPTLEIETRGVLAKYVLDGGDRSVIDNMRGNVPPFISAEQAVAMGNIRRMQYGRDVACLFIAWNDNCSWEERGRDYVKVSRPLNDDEMAKIDNILIEGA